ncbi:MAG: 1-(5-phosphoribosyl)-5-[(5-phosphoribosylamino)methylideneamino]imidazole-4-carboxamide isomerase [Chloroflexi bacterium]|nr:1-(5-phosphoribosyl)-5-[(5-phosphoribosylamino)methylideneamino]imidazole-4-carboxamide isomerase [Chloroflexota bacterium]
MPKFVIYPAIDLRNGQVVRLAQGDLARTTTYSDDPAGTARRWQAEGARWLHVVNLDGAFGHESTPTRSVQSLISILSTGLNIQFGGGLRDLESIRQTMQLGVSRAVIGTAAVENPALVDEALAEFGPERIAVGVDAKEGRVRIKGWAVEAAVTAIDLARRLRTQGVQTIIFTDVSRDGIGIGVNVESSSALAQDSGLAVIASGGVASADDVHRVRDAGLAGIIIGRALYEGHLNLQSLISNL